MELVRLKSVENECIDGKCEAGSEVEKCGGDGCEECLIVPVSDAVIEVVAVVIKSLDALVAEFAVE